VVYYRFELRVLCFAFLKIYPETRNPKHETKNFCVYLRPNYHLDRIGSPIMITDESGTVVKEKKYEAFGNLIWAEGTHDDKREFTSKEKDPTGFHYFGARRYYGNIGRFLSPDPYTLNPQLLDLCQPQTLNPYVYCHNDPVNYLDPWGLKAEVYWDDETDSWGVLVTYTPRDDGGFSWGIPRLPYYGSEGAKLEPGFKGYGSRIAKTFLNMGWEDVSDEESESPQYFDGQITIFPKAEGIGIPIGYIYSPSQGEFFYVGVNLGGNWPPFVGTTVHAGYSQVVKGLNIQFQAAGGYSGQKGMGVDFGSKQFGTYPERGGGTPNIGVNIIWIFGGD
jgi:RHS repeat-associated protein